MLRKPLIGTISALALAGAVGAVAVPATAAFRFGVSSSADQLQLRPRGPTECWQWSRMHQNWTWMCFIQPPLIFDEQPPLYRQYASGPYNDPGAAADLKVHGLSRETSR